LVILPLVQQLQQCAAEKCAIADVEGVNVRARLAAERVVNRIKSLPNYFVDSHFWESQAVRLLGFAEGPAFKTLESSRTTLLKHDARLTPWLENTALDLCEKYDIPAAPVVLSAE